MRAARIFAFARTMRWASVAGGARKARAISSVVRPEISRSVSATWASADSEGWQHVKIRRSGSSAISSPSSQRAALSGIASTGGGDVAVDRVEAGAPADAVDRLEAARGDEPRHRVGGDAVARPLLDGGPERVLHRLFGEVEVAEQADQRRQHLARIAPEQGRDGRGDVGGRGLGVDGHGCLARDLSRSGAGCEAARSRRRRRRAPTTSRRGRRAGRPRRRRSSRGPRRRRATGDRAGSRS